MVESRGVARSSRSFLGSLGLSGRTTEADLQEFHHLLHSLVLKFCLITQSIDGLMGQKN